jgi:hypothetical protein
VQRAVQVSSWAGRHGVCSTGNILPGVMHQYCGSSSSISWPAASDATSKVLTTHQAGSSVTWHCTALGVVYVHHTAVGYSFAYARMPRETLTVVGISSITSTARSVSVLWIKALQEHWVTCESSM